MPIALIPSWTIGVAKNDPIASPIPDRKSRFMQPLHPRGGSWPGAGLNPPPNFGAVYQPSRAALPPNRGRRDSGGTAPDEAGTPCSRTGALPGRLLAAKHERPAGREEQGADRERPDPDPGPERRDQVRPAEPRVDPAEEERQHAERREARHAIRQHGEDQASPGEEEREDIAHGGEAPRREVAAPERPADNHAAVGNPR